MISLEKCRQLVPDPQELSEEELVKIRDNLYEGAQLALEAWMKKGGGSKIPLGYCWKSVKEYDKQ